MPRIPGPPPAEVRDLQRVEDRLSFLYLERCTVHRDGNAITAQDDRGIVHVPAATVGAVLLGPGTRVTHQGMMLLAESGATAVWVGEQGVRYYAHGRGLSTSSRLLEEQARRVTNRDLKLDVARRMYAMRFPGEDVSAQTMQQLRGREGARVRKAYKAESERTGVIWTKRDYSVDDFFGSDPINQALSAATTCLYGVAHAVIVALGCSPGLGFVHTGHSRSFVYDIADLYKADIAIPAAFDVAAMPDVEDIAGETRRRVRDRVFQTKLLTTCVRDIRALLVPDDDESAPDWDVTYLWDPTARVAGGHNYDELYEW